MVTSVVDVAFVTVTRTTMLRALSMSPPSQADDQFEQHIDAARAAFDNDEYYFPTNEHMVEATKMINRGISMIPT